MNCTNPPKAEWRRAVNEMCRSCIYDPGSPGTWRAQAQACTAPHCALWKIRPVSTEKLPEALIDDLRHVGVNEELIALCVENALPGEEIL